MQGSGQPERHHRSERQQATNGYVPPYGQQGPYIQAQPQRPSAPVHHAPQGQIPQQVKTAYIQIKPQAAPTKTYAPQQYPPSHAGGRVPQAPGVPVQPQSAYTRQPRLSGQMNPPAAPVDSVQGAYQGRQRSGSNVNHPSGFVNPMQGGYQRQPRVSAHYLSPQGVPPGQQHEAPQREASSGASRKFHAAKTVSPEMRKRLLLLCSAVCLVIMIISGVQLVSYYSDYFSAEQASDELRAVYYDHQEEEYTAPVTPLPTSAPTATPAPEDTPVPTATPKVLLEAVKYPNNPFSTVRSRFKTIQRQNPDIIGWLKIDGILDEAVVQRDNTYYLKRDYRGYHNANGALFLDEECDLSTRPYTLMIYGHNMKTGVMFGCLRNYEHLYFYKENPFITFDSAYEDGRYVIVAVGNISTDVYNWKFINFAALLSNGISQREAALKSLMNRSIFGHDIEVTAEDQLLILLTCVGDETERRVVVARRIREDESEADLHRLVYRSWEKQKLN